MSDIASEQERWQEEDFLRLSDDDFIYWLCKRMGIGLSFMQWTPEEVKDSVLDYFKTIYWEQYKEEAYEDYKAMREKEKINV